ncbi:MAG TPA: RDD family protein [Streptomyces sp.]|nr:RDD family protein [Streptomyces sp.]
MNEQAAPQPHTPPSAPYGYSAPPPFAYAPPPLPGPPPELVGGMGRRFLAKLVDVVVCAALVAATVVLILVSESGGREVPALLVVLHFAVLFFVLVLYDPVLTAVGGTVGKRLCGLRVVRLETGRPVGFGAALGRHLMALLINGMTCLPLAYLWCTWDKPHHQGLHDKILRTVVVLR